MTITLKTLTEADVTVLRGIIKAEKDRARSDPLQRPQDRRSPANEIYVAKVPEAGIPALTLDGGAGTGTGGTNNDQPGTAVCDIYRITPDPAGDPVLTEIDQLKKLIHNISDFVITSTYTIVEKTKGGKWVAQASGGTTGTATPSGTGTTPGTATGTEGLRTVCFNRYRYTWDEVTCVMTEICDKICITGDQLSMTITECDDTGTGTQ